MVRFFLRCFDNHQVLKTMVLSSIKPDNPKYNLDREQDVREISLAMGQCLLTDDSRLTYIGYRFKESIDNTLLQHSIIRKKIIKCSE